MNEIINTYGRKFFSNRIIAHTKKYQKKYGFEIGTGEHATWNNEADALIVSQ